MRNGIGGRRVAVDDAFRRGISFVRAVKPLAERVICAVERDVGDVDAVFAHVLVVGGRLEGQGDVRRVEVGYAVGEGRREGERDDDVGVAVVHLGEGVRGEAEHYVAERYHAFGDTARQTRNGNSRTAGCFVALDRASVEVEVSLEIRAFHGIAVVVKRERHRREKKGERRHRDRGAGICGSEVAADQGEVPLQELVVQARSRGCDGDVVLEHRRSAVIDLGHREVALCDDERILQYRVDIFRDYLVGKQLVIRAVRTLEFDIGEAHRIVVAECGNFPAVEPVVCIERDRNVVVVDDDRVVEGDARVGRGAVAVVSLVRAAGYGHAAAVEGDGSGRNGYGHGAEHALREGDVEVGVLGVGGITAPEDAVIADAVVSAARAGAVGVGAVDAAYLRQSETGLIPFGQSVEFKHKAELIRFEVAVHLGRLSLIERRGSDRHLRRHNGERSHGISVAVDVFVIEIQRIERRRAFRPLECRYCKLYAVTADVVVQHVCRAPDISVDVACNYGIAGGFFLFAVDVIRPRIRMSVVCDEFSVPEGAVADRELHVLGECDDERTRRSLNGDVHRPAQRIDIDVDVDHAVGIVRRNESRRAVADIVCSAAGRAGRVNGKITGDAEALRSGVGCEVYPDVRYIVLAFYALIRNASYGIDRHRNGRNGDLSVAVGRECRGEVRIEIERGSVELREVVIPCVHIAEAVCRRIVAQRGSRHRHLPHAIAVRHGGGIHSEHRGDLLCGVEQSERVELERALKHRHLIGRRQRVAVSHPDRRRRHLEPARQHSERLCALPAYRHRIVLGGELGSDRMAAGKGVSRPRDRERYSAAGQIGKRLARILSDKPGQDRVLDIFGKVAALA